MDKLEIVLAQARKERDDADLHLKWLERQIAQIDAHDVKADSGMEPQKRTPKRRPLGRRKGPSVPVLAETILRAFPQGLMTTPLMAELRKIGYESHSKNPANTLNSILRQAGDTFRRLSDGRWILREFTEHQKKPEGTNGTKETPIH